MDESADEGTSSGGLTETEAEILRMEQHWWKYQGAKEAAVRGQLGMSLTRYYQVLNALIDKPEALAAEPATVSRLRRLRQQRRDQRKPDTE